MPLVWQRTPGVAFPALTEAYAAAIHRGVVAIAQRYAVEIEAYMKSEANWTDQTGEARRTLHSEVVNVAGEMVIIILGHGVDYGTYLELSNAGRYSIVFPTMDKYIPKIWRDVRALLRR